MQPVSVPKLIGCFLAALGALYAAVLLFAAMREREAFRKEKGSLAALCLLEAGVYFLATLGMSDFLPNAIAMKRLKLTEDKNIPGTLIAAALVPGAVIAFFLLQVENTVELKTLIPCCVAITAGAALGSKLVGKIDGGRIKKIMGIAMIFSMAAILLRMVLDGGTSGSLTGLEFPKLAAAVVFCFFWGGINMLGVPMKAAGSAMFLLLGVSPLSTLTLVLVIGCIGPMGGGVAIIREKRYYRKMACAAVVCGSAGAAAGSLFTISVPPLALNIMLLVVLAIAVVTMLRD